MRARQLFSSLVLFTLSLTCSTQAADNEAQYDAARTLLSLIDRRPRTSDARPRDGQQSYQAGSSAFPDRLAPSSPTGSFTTVSGGTPGPSSSSSRPHVQVTEGMPELGTQPWVPVDTIASTGRGEEEIDYQIPRFRHNGQTWGPFPIGSKRFEPQPYPLELPLFESLHKLSKYKPASIEDFLEQDHARNWRKLDTRGTVFVPEPRILQEIQRSIWAQLESHGIHAMTGQNGLHEGQWLWPPSEIAADRRGLRMSQHLLDFRFRKVFHTRFRSHYREGPSLFRLTVPSTEGERRILMVAAPAPEHVSVPVMLGFSKLWLFYEGVRHGTYQKVAFLGATFLPEAAKEVLLTSKTIQPAFKELRPK